ncbi:MAG: heme-binding protein, partial [Candidatus Thiodiazotropha sp. 6PLUC3]
CLQTALSKLAVGVLQRRFDALLQAGTLRLKTTYLVAGLIVGGGLVIEAQGETVGGIGVSGAPPGSSERDSIDGDCAQAGLQAIWEDLEFTD